MANFASEAISYISHLLPAEQEIKRYFTEDVPAPSEGEAEEEESFDFTEPLEQEHLEALAQYQEMVGGVGSPEDTLAAIYDFLREKSDLSYPFGFWYECCLSSSERNLALAYIMIMMSNNAVSPHESVHCLFTAALEAVNGVLEFEAEAFQLVTGAINVARYKLIQYVPFGYQPMVEALLSNYLETIDRGDDQMDRQLFAIESVYFKLISAH
ncbi:hypothetical protein HGA34_02915 [Candidatus Falkowbacteria bacterium]|nr:hypothetical protein [Candidatus Falkowbacteria bacterium]